jgi:hypothetical protein
VVWREVYGRREMRVREVWREIGREGEEVMCGLAETELEGMRESGEVAMRCGRCGLWRSWSRSS